MKRQNHRDERWGRLIESIKGDAMSGRGPITLLTLSVRDMEDTARRLTLAELRHVRFTFMGLSLQHLALPDNKPASQEDGPLKTRRRRL